MNLYIFACDISYGVEEWYQVTIQANNICDAIDKFIAQEDAEAEGSQIDIEYMDETVGHITEVTPSFEIREFSSYKYFLDTGLNNFISGNYDDPSLFEKTIFKS